MTKPPSWRERLDDTLPIHTTNCFCLICDWKPEIKDFISTLLAEVIEEIPKKDDCCGCNLEDIKAELHNKYL